MPSKETVEPILRLLAALMVFFTVCLFFCEHFFGSDREVFQAISNLLAGISGAFIMRIKPRSDTATIVQDSKGDPHNA